MKRSGVLFSLLALALSAGWAISAEPAGDKNEVTLPARRPPSRGSP